MFYLVSPGKNQSHVSEVVNQQNKASNQPVVHKVRENDQKHWKRMMKSKLIKVSLRPDEEMHKQPAEMLTELRQVVNLDWRCKLYIFREIVVNVHWTARATQPCWEVTCVSDEQETGQWGESVVKDRKSPFHQRVTSLLPGFWIGVSCVVYVILFT